MMAWVEFSTRTTGPERLIAEAEIHFDGGVMSGIRIVGFSLWRSAEGEVFVTVPSRAMGGGSDRCYYDMVRGTAGAMKDLREWILTEWHATQLPEVTS